MVNTTGRFAAFEGDEPCEECTIGYYFFPDDPDYQYTDPVNQIEGWEPPKPTDEQPQSCRKCPAGRHTYGNGTGEACTECAPDSGKIDDHICQGGSCRLGHADLAGGFCASCVDLDTDAASGLCGPDAVVETTDPLYRDTCGFFAKGSNCEPCSDPKVVMVLGASGLTISTSVMTYAIVKGFSSDDVGRIQGGMDFTKAITATFGMFQRLTAILTLPFGWPAWLVELCYTLKGIVSFDLPGLAAPECAAKQTPAEMQLTRLLISAFALPVIWILIFFEMIIIRNCTKLGKRKAARGTSLFGCTLFGFGKCGCPEGAFQSVVITMHGLFFLNVIQSAFAALNCMEVPDATGGTRMALAVNPSVYCETSPGENWSEDDAVAYLAIKSTANIMVIFFGVLMSFLHWSVRVEYVGIWNKAFVSYIVIFYGREQDATTALVFLAAVSGFFGFMGNRWRVKLGGDGDDSNDAEEDAFFCMEVGAYCELMTYGFGLTLVEGYELEPGQIGIEVSWYSWANVAAYTILFVMTGYAIWTFKLGIQDEIAARKAEKAAVAHILFREMDADGSGKLDFGEVHALCERLGQKKTDEEVTEALKQMDKDGSMEADADEFVEWWIHHGGRKVPIPDELMDLANAAGGRSAPRGNPFHTSDDFQIDDEVRWFKVDDDVPRGSIGHVVGFKPKAGGGWKSGNLGIGPKVAAADSRVYVAWPNACYFAHNAGELLLFSGTRSVPLGANWRGSFPKSASEEAATEEEGDAETPSNEGEGEEEGEAAEAEAAAPYDGPMEAVEVQFDFIVGDHVVATEGCAVENIPKGEIGAVTGFNSKLIAKVLFASCEEEFEVAPMDLRLEVAHADNTVVETWKHISVQHAQLVMEQTQADEDYATLVAELGEMSEKALKKRLAKLYPHTDATKIDKKQGNGIDDRLDEEKKKVWRQRILVEHSVEILDEEKAEADGILGAKIAETVERKEAVRIDYEHLTHKQTVGVHEARIGHAEKMHEEVTKQHKQTLKNVKAKRHWTVRASKARKKPDQVMREEAARRGIDTSGLKKAKHVKKAVIAHQEQEGVAHVTSHLSKIEDERQRHGEREAEHDGFETHHGIEPGSEPGSVAGLVSAFDKEGEGEGEGSISAFKEESTSKEKQDKKNEKKPKKKKKKKKKGRKEASEPEDNEKFDNPLAEEE